MKVGLFFGSFNPIHIGHLIIANTLCQEAGLDEVWFVVSPHNPFKNQSDLAPADLRLKWVAKAVEGNNRLKASGIELDLPLPSYTYQTLAFLKSQNHEFHLLMGSDTFNSLPRWKNAEDFIYDYPLEIYLRPGSEEINIGKFPNASIHQMPLLDISATRIRSKITENREIKYLVVQELEDEIKDFYKKNLV